MSEERNSAVSMDELIPKEREALKAILAKEPAALTEAEREHLKGRAAYLDANQRKDYLGDGKPAKAEPTEEAPKKTTKKK